MKTSQHMSSHIRKTCSLATKNTQKRWKAAWQQKTYRNNGKQPGNTKTYRQFGNTKTYRQPGNTKTCKMEGSLAKSAQPKKRHQQGLCRMPKNEKSKLDNWSIWQWGGGGGGKGV